MIYEAIDEYQIRRRLRALVTKVDGKLRIAIEDIGGIATCHISQHEAHRLADFLVDAGFGAAEDRPDVSGHDARDASDLTLDDRFDVVDATIESVESEIVENLVTLACKFAVLEENFLKSEQYIHENLVTLFASVLKLEDFSGIGADTRGQDVLMKASDVTIVHRFDAVYSCMDEIENAVCSQKQDIASLDARLSALEAKCALTGRDVVEGVRG